MADKRSKPKYLHEFEYSKGLPSIFNFANSLTLLKSGPKTTIWVFFALTLRQLTSGGCFRLLSPKMATYQYQGFSKSCGKDSRTWSRQKIACKMALRSGGFHLKFMNMQMRFLSKKQKNSVSVIKASAYVQRCKIDIFNIDWCIN